MSLPTSDRIRRAVADTYHRVVERRHTSTAATRLAGYTDAELAQLPDGVTPSFFGCGNPLAYTRVTPGQTVLDLGSGAGLDLILAGQTVGPSGRVIGVDMTEAMITRARDNVARAGLENVEIRTGVIEALPVDTASVDWVISNCVVSLSPDKPRVFREIARVLRPGGRMLISDIVVDAPLAWVLRRLVRIAPSIAMARTEAAYVEAIEEAGLVDFAVLDRLVYEADDLIGLFAGEPTAASTGACPVTTVGDRLRASAPARGATRIAATAVAGHVWSSKLAATRA